MTKSERQAHDADRQVNQENTAPAYMCYQQAAQDWPCGKRNSSRRTPPAHSTVSLLRIRKSLTQHRQRIGHQQCGANALYDACGDEKRQRAGDPTPD